MTQPKTTRTAAGANHVPKRVTALRPGDLELPDDVAELIGGDVLRSPTGRKALSNARVASIRHYRRLVDEAIYWMRRGIMHPRDGKQYVDAIKTGAELLMSERMLQHGGKQDIEPEHIIDNDGGMGDYGATEYTPPVVVKKSERRGVGADGNPIDETRVEITGDKAILEDLE